MPPRMIVIAGPPGSGKSSAFPVSSFGVAYFNADDRAAALNSDSYQGISQDIRRVVNREYEEFVLGHIQSRESFAIETTLRSQVTFEQASVATANGFRVEMRYLALESFQAHLERIKIRSDAGGHSASETTLRRIYEASLANLRPAIDCVDQLWVYDNSRVGREPALVLESSGGQITFLADPAPAWLQSAFA